MAFSMLATSIVQTGVLSVCRDLPCALGVRRGHEGTRGWAPLQHPQDLGFLTVNRSVIEVSFCK